MSECVLCGKKLSGKQERFCGITCSKIWHKRDYRKRKREQLNAYARSYRKQGIRGNPSDNSFLKRYIKNHPYCLKCDTKVDVQVHHIKPRKRGGKNETNNLMTLCRKHHYEFEQLTKGFWV